MEFCNIITDTDPNFQPVSRGRSNTWPLRPAVEVSPDHQNSPGSDEAVLADTSFKECGKDISVKLTSRRNAWGNMSYADLITKAIQSSPDQRLTLSQIYDWMVTNVPFFHGKGESNSSAGWKNSIRHNLSLHSRFMRLPNDGGAGKSSWWVINPEAKAGKTQRSRRANSMETKAMEKKRYKAKKRAEAIRSGMEESSSRDRFFLNPHDSGPFRDRTSSNASTVSGRLSPIPALDKDLDDELIQWDPNNGSIVNENNSSNMYVTNESMSEILVDSLMSSMHLDGNIGLPSTPEESMVTENGFSTGALVQDPFLPTVNPVLAYSLSDSSCSGNVSSTSPAPYSSVEAISPPHSQLTDNHFNSPGEDFSTMMVFPDQPEFHQRRAPGNEQQVINPTVLTSILENYPGISPYGAPNSGVYRSPEVSYIDSNQSNRSQGQSLSPNSDYSSPGQVSSPSRPVQLQLTPLEVRFLILNSSTNVQWRELVKQIPLSEANNSEVLKLLTDKTNLQLTQSQIARLKQITQRVLLNNKMKTSTNAYLNPPKNVAMPVQSSIPVPIQRSYSPSVNVLAANIQQASSAPSSFQPQNSIVQHMNVLTTGGAGNDPFLTDYLYRSNNTNDFASSTPDISGLTSENLCDLDFSSFPAVGCDVDQILDYEMSLDDDLDFNFDPSSSFSTDDVVQPSLYLSH